VELKSTSVTVQQSQCCRMQWHLFLFVLAGCWLMPRVQPGLYSIEAAMEKPKGLDMSIWLRCTGARVA
jgi:hypothetical protein